MAPKRQARSAEKTAPEPPQAPVVPLPQHGPSTGAEMYLAAILAATGAVLAELRELREDLKAKGGQA